MTVRRGNSELELVGVVTLCNELGISEKTLAKWIEAGMFPAPLRLGLRKRVWLKKTIVDHIAKQAAEAAGKKR